MCNFCGTPLPRPSKMTLTSQCDSCFQQNSNIVVPEIILTETQIANSKAHLKSSTKILVPFSNKSHETAAEGTQADDVQELIDTLWDQITSVFGLINQNIALEIDSKRKPFFTGAFAEKFSQDDEKNSNVSSCLDKVDG